MVNRLIVTKAFCSFMFKVANELMSDQSIIGSDLTEE